MNDEYTPSITAIRDGWGLAVDFHRRPEKLAEFDRAMAAHDAEIRAEQIETDAEIAGDIEYIRDWDGYTPDDASHNTRLRAAEAIRAQLAPRPPAPELTPGIQAALDALSIYRKG